MAHEDWERLNWLEAIAAELDVRITKDPDRGLELYIGRALIPGVTLRDAIDAAMEGAS